MSVVACKISDGKIRIASDSITVRGWTQSKGENKHSKLFECNGLIIGAVGLCEESSLLKVFCTTRKPEHNTENSILLFWSEFSEWKKKKTTKHQIENAYIFIMDGKAFYIHEFFINEILTFEAIGAGEDFALAALHLGHDAKQAVGVACELSVFCEQPIKSFECAYRPSGEKVKGDE